MGSLVGHVVPGFGFFLIGIWHLINNIKLHAINPKSYTSLPWFPFPKIRYLELFLFIFSSIISILMELFIGPQKHQPLDLDGTIPSNHLRNFEHSNISLTFLVYALFSITIDKTTLSIPTQFGLSQFLGAIAFGHEFLVFHLHSSDHMGVEGQYYWLLQIIIFMTFFTILSGIPFPNSFLNSFVRSYSIIFQGIWFMVMGIMIWTPKFIPKGCVLNSNDLTCPNPDDLKRAKSLVNIEFSWYLIGVTIFVVSFYLVLVKIIYREKVQYQILASKFEDEKGDIEDVEAQEERSKSELNNIQGLWVYV
ncbi:transmembrane protein 45B [Capsicum annuum]